MPLYAHTDLVWSNPDDQVRQFVPTGEEVDESAMHEDVLNTFKEAGAVQTYPRVDETEPEAIGEIIAAKDDRIKELESALAIARGEPDPHPVPEEAEADVDEK